MNKDELVRKLAEESGISTIDIYQLVNTAIQSMSNALSKGKNVNISEFGKFKTLSRRDETGKLLKTVSFSPVKKFAHDVNFRYNDLSPTPIGVISQKEEEARDMDVTEISQEVALRDEVSESINFDTKNLPDNINPRVMDNKDKYDGNIIRDELSQDSSNDSSDSIEAFIQSKLDKSQSKIDSGIKEFELPHTLIELHNDITNEDGSIDESILEEETSPQNELPEINEQVDIESLIEERKRALGDVTPEYKPEPTNEESNDYTIDDSKNLHIEDRDKLEEFRSFEDERNAELSKIIAERNKIIEDINDMVNNTDDIPQAKETPVEGKPYDNSIEDNIDNIQNEEPVNESNKEEPLTEDLPPLQEDKTFEHKSQYDEGNLIDDNFDPIVTDDETLSSHNMDYTANDILTPEDTQSFSEEQNFVDNTPKSFEDVFETKNAADELQKQEKVIHSELPQIKQEDIKGKITEEVKVEIKKEVPPPPVQQVSYTQKMQQREKMFEEKSSRSAKRGFWITAIILGFLILVIYLAYNTGSFSPPEQTEGNQNNNEKNTQPQNNEQSPPPVSNEQEQNEKGTTTAENKQEGNIEKTNEQTPPSNSPEEVTFDNSLNVAFVKTSDGIYIQTASLKNKSDADRMASNTPKGSKEVLVKEADLGDKGKYYRVRIGKFASMDEAKEFAGKLK